VATTRIGVISDTHGVLRPEAVGALQGCVLILHAGDVGAAGIVDALARIAPVVAVRGNVDTAPWARGLPATEVVEVDGRHLYVLHQIEHLDLDPVAGGFAAVIYGHSHKPSAEVRGGVLYLNPGSAGPRRFNLPITVVRLVVTPTSLEPEFVNLETPRGACARWYYGL
jgi:putative phosphoesterase